MHDYSADNLEWVRLAVQLAFVNEKVMKIAIDEMYESLMI